MEVGGSAISIASFGIQICEVLLSYYNAWKDYESDVRNTYDAITNLSRTLTLLKTSLNDEQLDEERRARVKRSLESSEDGLIKLSKKLQKLRTYDIPDGIRQKLWSEIQRMWYPFRVSTLAKVREIVDDAQEQLQLAVEVLQLDVSSSLRKTLAQVDTRTAAIEASVAQISTFVAAQKSEQFQRVVDWLSPTDPWTYHVLARQRHEPYTGEWLLQSDQYRSWKAGTIRHLWIYGKAGCGKTVLCSTAIEDVRVYCDDTNHSTQAIFYFSFSDNHKQSYEDLLRSLTVQLGLREPGLSMLLQAYKKLPRNVPEAIELEKILLLSVKSYDQVFIQLDALDECPEGGEIRRNILERLEWLIRSVPNTKILITSRELYDVRESMEVIGANPISIAASAINIDIRKYVSSELLHDRRLRRLDSATKVLIEETMLQKADGMFRWVYCQLQELKKLKSTKQKYVKTALLSLPPTLDETYKRMLISIEEMYRREALLLLRWLAYAKSPLSLSELAEAAIIDPTAAKSIDTDNYGGLEDTLNILSGLVITERDDKSKRKDNQDTKSEYSDFEDSNVSVLGGGRAGRDTKVRLAHFSIKEFLESERMLETDAKEFFLKSDREQRFLAQSCLTYMRHYSSSSDKTKTEQDFVTFPLLQYAAKSWFYHSSLHSDEVSSEVFFLSSEDALRDWLLLYDPDLCFVPSFSKAGQSGSGLYYASVLGLKTVVEGLLKHGSDVNAFGGYYGNPLQGASVEGHESLVRLLIENGAHVDAPGKIYGNALQLASWRGHMTVVQMLIDTGADVNAQNGWFGNALQAASLNGYWITVTMLINNGAEVSAQGGHYGSALQAASYGGDQTTVEILIDRGSNVNTQGGEYGNALLAASYRGNEGIVQLLIDSGANINAEGGDFSNALQAASTGPHEKVVQMLIDNGADVNAQGGKFSNALQAASWGSSESVVQLLINSGANVNAQGGEYGNALQAASYGGHKKVVKRLIQAGANVDAPGGVYGNALRAASVKGHEEVMHMLIAKGAARDRLILL